MKRLSIISLFFLLMASFLAGCGQDQTTNHQGHEVGHVEQFKEDTRETTASIEELPNFLEHYHSNIIDIYERVPYYQDLLEHIPCYCGCADYVSHRHTYDCFVHEHFENGNVQWDDHGARCGVCLEIAHYSMKYYDEGVSPLQIRQIIDEMYKEGFPEPTDTPMPVS
ncbi:PCYCGC motif-containing (lipo)protein [Alkalihalobacterium chitinilyticum]|uniref:PCYCGC domain-containing protein n=1 Tax=Alkalihalobacterium chitinilyticum TaxID=2980103 RepID=A0ABT5VHQ1_9BACI|nr:PCYCGC motif-containing (lipo)protein [Alkalihalobacterium chitinilyticum]MDE5414980.1 PCYCGC domain-containing protein [Alkalihalobacterium chitinilyticum]